MPKFLANLTRFFLFPEWVFYFSNFSKIAHFDPTFCAAMGFLLRSGSLNDLIYKSKFALLFSLLSEKETGQCILFCMC